MRKLIVKCLYLMCVSSLGLFAADSAGISGTVTTLPLQAQETAKLTQGWNLVGINANLTLKELQNQIGADNLLIIQGPSKTYKKENVDSGNAFLNDFKEFENAKGYWLKVGRSANIKYKPAMPKNITISLLKGWNLINPTKPLTLAQIKTQVGADNLLVIQGPSKTYKKENVDNGNPFLNDFTHFEEPKGYWVKVKNASKLSM